MEQDTLVLMGRYKAHRLCETKSEHATSVESRLPAEKQLWELHDRNINIAVWTKANEA